MSGSVFRKQRVLARQVAALLGRAGWGAARLGQAGQGKSRLGDARSDPAAMPGFLMPKNPKALGRALRQIRAAPSIPQAVVFDMGPVGFEPTTKGL